jgi:hypothetical protein
VSLSAASLVLNLISTSYLAMAIFIATDAFVLVVIAIFSYVVRITRKRNRLPYPPGPKGYPLIGSALKDFGDERWIAYRDISAKYGQSAIRLIGRNELSKLDPGTDILHFNMAGTHLIVLNSAKTCIELLEKRSAIYSDR